MRLFYKLFGRIRVKAGCGHKTRLSSEIVVGRASRHGVGNKWMTVNFNPFKGIKYCHRCLERMITRCAWCGEPILPGDPITLCTPTDENFKVPAYAVVYSEKPLRLVGCLRWNCAESGAFRSGFWMPPGKVKRVESPLEQVARTNEIVVVNNLSRP